MKKRKEELKEIEEEIKKAANEIRLPDWESRREELLKKIHEQENQQKDE